MSTAVMPQSAMYDFGDIMLKVNVARFDGVLGTREGPGRWLLPDRGRPATCSGVRFRYGCVGDGSGQQLVVFVRVATGSVESNCNVIGRGCKNAHTSRLHVWKKRNAGLSCRTPTRLLLLRCWLSCARCCHCEKVGF